MAIVSRSWLNARLLGIAEEEALFSRRRFPSADPKKQLRLEGIGRTFVAGYRAALRIQRLVELRQELDRFDDERRGFAFEGAGMALALTDALWRQRRFAGFLSGAGAHHCYMLHVGLGWAVARLPWMRGNLSGTLERQDPLLGGLIVDGYGFHEGYFHWEAAIAGRRIPMPVRRNLARAEFDQGLGRSLWFFNGADVERTVACLSAFAPQRHADLWCGVGLAATYAGGASEVEIAQLREACGRYWRFVAQGAAFAAAARLKAGNMVRHTEMATRIFCGQSVTEATAVTDAARARIQGSAEPYGAWRAEISKSYTAGVLR